MSLTATTTSPSKASSAAEKPQHHQRLWLFVKLLLASVFFKVLLFPAYHSTDFEVHRNWLAITHSKPLSEWYFEETSEWTLDYPPFFAYFEYVLSRPAALVDPQMVNVTNLNYKANTVIVYQRLTVILSEFTFVYALYKFLSSDYWPNAKKPNFILNTDVFLVVQFLLNFALIIIDNIHFQYNGFLFGLMMLSVYYIQNNKVLLGSFIFSSLINFKHIYLYVAPAYFFYIFFFYCMKAENFTKIISRLTVVGLVVIVPFVLSLGPFIYLNQIPQLIKRLFPFKRGLCHAYWAPNAWSLYNFVDKILSIVQGKRGSSSTSGLVQDIEHVVLPSVSPTVTFILSFVFIMVPILALLIKLARTNSKHFKKLDVLNTFIVICAFSSFLFGWHVHEKAVLLILVPLSLLSTKSPQFASLYFYASTISNYSLFPLLFRVQEYPVKCLLFLIFTTYNYYSLKYQFENFDSELNIIEKLSLMAILPIELSIQLFNVLGFGERWPYLPLLAISVFCAFGIIFSWLKFLYLILVSSQNSQQKQQEYKKVN